MNSNSPKGFSLIELVVAIAVAGILATAFISAFSTVLRTSTSPQDLALESIVAGKMDELLSGSFQSAVAASGTCAMFSVNATTPLSCFPDDHSFSYYSMVITGQSSVVSGITINSGVHLTVTAGANFLCASCVGSLSGDTFDVQ